MAGKGRFLPGQSGNPKGRPPGLALIRAAFLEAAPRAKEIILELAEHATDERVRLMAAKEILDRAIGKAPIRDDEDNVVRDTVLRIEIPSEIAEDD